MLKEKDVILCGKLKISYLDNELANKSVILFVHGWGADKFNLKSIYHSLINDFRIISLDLPGFGKSDKPDSVYDSKSYAEIICDFLKQLNINNINYVGHSFGGKIGILLSLFYPNIVKRLVLIDSSGLRSRRNIIWYFRVGLYKLFKFFIIRILRNNQILEKLRKNIGSDDYKNSGDMRAILVKTVQEDLTKYLSKIKCPVFLYWGEYDDATPLWMAKKMNKLIPDSGLYIVKNGSHFSFLEDNRIISIIKEFAI